MNPVENLELFPGRDELVNKISNIIKNNEKKE